jgi:hypothetical protein
MTSMSLPIQSTNGLADTPACQICGSPTRLFGLEPHPNWNRTDLHTYVCDACEGSQVQIVPLTL